MSSVPDDSQPTTQSTLPLKDVANKDRLVDIARFIEENIDVKLTLNALAERAECSPSALQRAFKNAFGVSPKQYQDGLRMAHFKDALQQGHPVTDAIYASGFGSISRVYGMPSRQIGMSPMSYRAGGQGETIDYACRHTILGWMIMAATEKGVCCVQFSDDEASLVSLLNHEFPNAELRPSNAQTSPALNDWVDALDHHISSGAPRPDLPLDMRGTAFQIKVWQFLLHIKEGDTHSYGELATQIDRPNAVRAVGTACGKNRIAVLIPCHRVLRSDGSLGGYRWGLERKQALLNKENDG